MFFTLSFDFTEEVVAESLAATFPDFIAVIGGNIGLFTGFSLFSPGCTTRKRTTHDTAENEKLEMWKTWIRDV